MPAKLFPHQRRDVQLSFKVRSDEAEALQRQAEAAGMSLAQFVRQAVNAA